VPSIMKALLSKTAKKKLNFGTIMSNKNNPVRMCIVCKARIPQSELLRLQVDQGGLRAFTKVGRSFYVCDDCIDTNNKQLKKALLQKCKKLDQNILDYGKMLKEIETNG